VVGGLRPPPRPRKPFLESLRLMDDALSRARAILRREGLLGLARRGGRRVFAPALLPVTIGSLRRERAKAHTIADAVALAFSERYRWLVGPWQSPYEVTETLEVLHARRPRTVLEIGTCRGGGLFLYSLFAARDATLVTVDLPGGPFGGGYAPWRAPLYRSFARGSQRIELVRGDSHRADTFRRVEHVLGGREVEFLFIDGDHSYEGVRADFRMYSSLVCEGGVVGFHDIVPGPGAVVGGVPRFWQELKPSYEDAREFVQSWEGGSGGVGLLPSFRQAPPGSP
jgi:cephalosporin hydroxylase